MLRQTREPVPAARGSAFNLQLGWLQVCFWGSPGRGDRGARTNPHTLGDCGAVACGLLSAREFRAPVLTASCLWERDQNLLSGSARGRVTVVVHQSQRSTVRVKPLAPALPQRAQHGAGWKRGRSPAWGRQCRLVRQPRSEAWINAARAPSSVPEVPKLSIFSEF